MSSRQAAPAHGRPQVDTPGHAQSTQSSRAHGLPGTGLVCGVNQNTERGGGRGGLRKQECEGDARNPDDQDTNCQKIQKMRKNQNPMDSAKTRAHLGLGS